MKAFWLILIGLASFVIIQSCQTEEIFIDTIVNEPIDTTTPPVSFKDQIIPFFNESCNNSPCHRFGGIRPDLSEINAYQSLINGGLVDLENPQMSQIYQSLEFGNGRGGQMPPGAKIQKLNELILKWIQQGALNN
ncbi:MAG: hypothetical protein OEM26_15105 [Saprospiraceae bacterium]|nr:hypothetical protein [Saprospiraceae bacterium]